MADFPANDYSFASAYALSEGVASMNLTTPAETLEASGSTPPVYHYVMLGYDTVFPLAETMWPVTGTPDLTGASSGNPTINAATIRIFKSWVE